MLFWAKFLKLVLLFNKNCLIYSFAKLNLNGMRPELKKSSFFYEDYIVSVKLLRVPIDKTFIGIIKKPT